MYKAIILSVFPHVRISSSIITSGWFFSQLITSAFYSTSILFVRFLMYLSATVYTQRQQDMKMKRLTFLVSSSVHVDLACTSGHRIKWFNLIVLLSCPNRIRIFSISAKRIHAKKLPSANSEFERNT